MAMLFAGMTDFQRMIIPNWVSVVLIVAFALLAPVAGLPLKDIGFHALAFIAVLAIGFGFFSAGWVGAGDVKLLAAGSLWVGSGLMLNYLFNVTVFGAILCTMVWAFRKYTPEHAVPDAAWATRMYSSDHCVPYGIAIGLGSLLTFPKTPLYALVMG